VSQTTEGVEELVIKYAVEDKVEGEVAVDEQVGDARQALVELTFDELVHRLTLSE